MFYENRNGFPLNTALSLSLSVFFAKLYQQRHEPFTSLQNQGKVFTL